MSRKIILNIAISLDGCICEEDGTYEWIKGQGDTDQDTEEQFDFSEFLRGCDTIVMGRRAFEDCGIESIEGFEQKKFYVATHEMRENYENVEFISGDIVSIIEGKKLEEGKNIWLFGGAQLVDAFLKAGSIDEYVIGIIPVILGKGRKLFLDQTSYLKLKLEECTVTDGIAMLCYSKRE